MDLLDTFMLSFTNLALFYRRFCVIRCKLSEYRIVWRFFYKNNNIVFYFFSLRKCGLNWIYSAEKLQTNHLHCCRLFYYLQYVWNCILLHRQCKQKNLLATKEFTKERLHWMNGFKLKKKKKRMIRFFHVTFL